MKNGDMVVVTDGSYIQEITSNGLKSVFINYREAKGLQHRVIATKCLFPKECSIQPDDYLNDTIICGTEGVVAYRFFVVCNRFLAPAKHVIVIDGQSKELSHESFLNLKRQFL